MVTAIDGVRCGVPVRIDTHPQIVRPYALNQIADSLRIARMSGLSWNFSGDPHGLMVRR
jgi:hypothetical protein